LPAAIEGQLDLRMPLESLLVGSDRVVDPPVGGCDQSPATQAVGECRGALEPPGVSLVPLEQLHCLVATPELDEGLDLVDDERDRTWLGDRLPPGEGDDGLEPRNRGVRGAKRKLEVAERRRGHELRPASSGFRHETENPLRRISGSLRSAPLRFDEALQRHVVNEDGVLPGLFGRVLSLERPRQGAFELAELALDMAQEDEKERR